MEFLAHVKPAKKVAGDVDGWDCHDLETHLREVARRTAESVGPFAPHEWGQLAGLWHDLGKYQPEFHTLENFRKPIKLLESFACSLALSFVVWLST